MPLLTTTAIIYLGTWNARTMWDTGRAAEMRKYNLEVLGISEAHWTQVGQLRLTSGELLIYSGHEEENALHTQGVALMLSNQAQNALIGWESHGSRIIKASFKTKKEGISMNIIQCYAMQNRSWRTVDKVVRTCTNPITIDGEDLKDVKTLTYLGSIIDEHGRSDGDMKARIGKARATYLHLRNIWKSKKLSTNTKQIKNFSVKNVPEYKIQKLTKSNFVLLHYGLFHIIWDWLLLILTFYIAFIVPYNVTFESHSTHSGRCRIIDLMVEIFLIVDVILNFHTTYVNKNGQIINDRHLIAKHYAKGWLILDLLAALPVDFILIICQITSIINLNDVNINTNLIEKLNDVNNSINETNGPHLYYNDNKHDIRPIVNFNLISLLQMMKLARLLRLARLIQKIIRLSQYSVIVLGLLMFSFALVAHWCACIWYVIGLYEIDGSDIGLLYLIYIITWIHVLPKKNSVNISSGKNSSLSNA
ncbi:unnamed protein product [Schistosoma margrebowiei]|uniref:Uncharacterized protein n=2 Tax=Schistosoma margrebowiei TaxID=48269 RepID=A0A183MZH1_9TREM|nr:unnamed protein product [Schistosoma margrebowiei]